MDACIEAVKAAEGGPQRERLENVLRLRQERVTLNVQAPDADHSNQLAKSRSTAEAVVKMAADVMLHFYRAEPGY